MNARPKVLGQSVTSPVDISTRKEVVIRVPPIAQLLYIGGAGDKRGYPMTLPGKPFGPFKNIDDVNRIFSTHLIEMGLNERFKPDYFGYYDVYGDERIKRNIVPAITNKANPIFIIGHSLGGWNGAHLSNWLNSAGFSVEMLVTLDPVGEGFMVTAVSDIYARSAHVAARTWINVRAVAKDRNESDFIAGFGGQWEIKNGPTINAVVDTNHANAVRMFYAPLNGGPSAAALVAKAIRRLAT